MTLEIAPKGKKAAEEFSIKVATPAGLSTLDARDGILAVRPLLVMERYDFGQLWAWLEKTVAACQADTWNDCVEALRRYFSWEYDDYTEG